MNGRRGEYGCDGIYWQDGVAVAVVGVWQPQKAMGQPSGRLWLNDKRIRETHCGTQSSSDLTSCTQPWFLGSLFPGKSFWSCAHSRETSAQSSASEWKMAKGCNDLLEKRVGKEHGMREGVSYLYTAAGCSWLLCFILTLRSQKGLL